MCFNFQPNSEGKPSHLAPKEAARLKTALLSYGVRLSDPLRHDLVKSVRPAMRVRSGSCGGLDIVLPGGTYVNCPINEPFVHASPYSLEIGDDGFVLCGPFGDDYPVSLLPMPDYYSQTTRNGETLSNIGQLCGDRLGIGLTNDCIYWRHPSERCKFCSIGLNLKTETRRKPFDDIIEVVDAALSDSVSPARHILLGGGTPSGLDAGALGIAGVARAIRMRWDAPIYAMIAAPSHNDVLYELHNAGVTELGMNIELFDRDVAKELMPGKHQAIGLDRYLEALEMAVGTFGRFNARSIMIVGLESMETTLKGVDLLASIGVLPILSPFRPFAGTILGKRPPPSFEFLWETLEAATEVAAKHDMPLGPMCIPCQGNTLTIPNHPAYLS